ncbi:unnamed protein product [Brachionus calyciflorus]|uniref:Uncharacterized protein n=1 Tax=Brachionus calyciflorus TaxID=104777 RepID=A0A813UML5_9BILA|nr:unnamed protein product [Brachionus calyciflorus]
MPLINQFFRISLKTIFLIALFNNFVQLSSAFSNCSYFPNYPNKDQVSFTRCDYICCGNARNPGEACCSNLWIIAPITGGIILLIVIVCIISIILCLCKVACGCLECFLCPCCICCG